MTGLLDQSIISELDSRQRSRHNIAYKLAEGAGYGFDVAFPEELSIDEARMALTIPFADGARRDGVGDLLEVGGIRTERHRLNPIVLFDHGKQVPYPIAQAQDPDTGMYTVHIDPVNQKAELLAFFYQGKKRLPNTSKADEYSHAVFCEQLFDMAAKRFIRSGSIGYQVIQAKQLSPDYERGIPAGMHLLSVLMLEGSLVVLPANQDTVRKMLGMPKICGKPLSPYLIKSLTPYAGPKKAQVAVPHGDLTKTKIPPPRWKPGVGAVKSEKVNQIKELRSKYKSSKIKRMHRVVKGKPGRSMLWINSKDLSKAKEAANNLGVKCEWITSKGSFEKLRLIGDDNNMMTIAQQFGRKIKSLDNALNKVSKLLQNKTKEPAMATKALDNRPPEEEMDVQEDAVADETPADVPPEAAAPEGDVQDMGGPDEMGDVGDVDEMGEGGEGGVDGLGGEVPGDQPSMPEEDQMSQAMKAEEPYGALVLRRLHEDHSILLEQYDKMIRLLEQEGVKSHLMGVLHRIAETLEEGEELFDEVYAELGGVGIPEEGEAQEKGMEEAEEAPPMEEEVAEGEEAPEGEEEQAVEEEGAEDEVAGELETESVPTDSESESEEPTGDEAIEGMEKVREDESAEDEGEEDDGRQYKSLDPKRTKALMQKYSKSKKVVKKERVKPTKQSPIRNKSVDEKSHHRPTPEYTGATHDTHHSKPAGVGGKQPRKYSGAAAQAVRNVNESGSEAATAAARRQSKGLPVEGKSACACGETPCKCQEKAMEPGDTDTKIAPAVAIPAAMAVGSAVGGMLNSNEKKSIGEASGFFKESSETETWDDEWRMKSYHYHKTLEGIASLDEAHESLESDGKAMPGSEEWAQEEANEPEHKSHRKMCKDASAFCRELSMTKNYGDKHRQKAAYWHRALDPISKEESPDDPSDEEVGGMVAEDAKEDGDSFEVGEMGEKNADGSVNRLKALIDQQNKEMELLEKRLERLVSV